MNETNETNELIEQIESEASDLAEPSENTACESEELASTDEPECENLETQENMQDAEIIRALKEELETLKGELQNSRAAYERLSSECADFSELYPDVSVTSLPDSVWTSFKSGVPLAAAYALYEKRQKSATEKAINVNAKNKELSSGSLNSSKTEEFFSPAEVRAMSAAEVRANYAKIITSMSKWH